MLATIFTIKDERTEISAIAIRPGGAVSLAEEALWRRSGFGTDSTVQSGYVLLGQLSTMKFSHDPYGWSNRTMKAAHEMLIANWWVVASGGELDVQAYAERMVGLNPRLVE